VRLVAISVDDRKHAAQVWNQVVKRQFTVLSDPGALVIRKYGLVHPYGGQGEDIALDTTLLVDEQGREVWRRVSETLPDLPTAAETLERIRNSSRKSKPESQNGREGPCK
jgi:peroxiredoxin